MEQRVDDRIRTLAQPLWESASRPYGMAIDFWLMAEQMVLEAMTAAARLHDKAVSPPPFSPGLGEVPVEAPLGRVRELAECMWDSAGKQYGTAQEYWLSAERHVLAMLRAATFPVATGPAFWADELKTLSAADYLQRIRMIAYHYWQNAGRGCGHALDFWLQAEREMLEAMAAATERGTPLGAAAVLSPAGGVPADAPAHAETAGRAPPRPLDRHTAPPIRH